MKFIKYLTIFILITVGCVWLWLLLSQIQKQWPFLEMPILFGFFIGFIIFALLTFIRKVSTSGSTIASVLITIISVSAIAEIRSKSLMCEEVQRLGGIEFKRNSFLWSVVNTPDEWQFEIDATTLIQTELYGWSYQEMTFYKIPIDAVGNVGVPNKNEATCP